VERVVNGAWSRTDICDVPWSWGRGIYAFSIVFAIAVLRSTGGAFAAIGIVTRTAAMGSIFAAVVGVFAASVFAATVFAVIVFAAIVFAAIVFAAIVFAAILSAARGLGAFSR
jgi:hypothetical protein